jgi:hypothetical protein
MSLLLFIIHTLMYVYQDSAFCRKEGGLVFEVMSTNFMIFLFKRIYPYCIPVHTIGKEKALCQDNLQYSYCYYRL